MKCRLAIVVLAGFFAGCSALEQYHFPQTQDKVPVSVIVAYSEAHPNEVIKSITEEKMFDGAVRYQFIIADSKNVERTSAFSQDGKPID